MTKIINKENAIKGYKGFNIDSKGKLYCRYLAFKEGPNNINSTTDKVRLCAGGIHFCRNINSVFNYYPLYSLYDLKNVQFCEVEGWGKVDDQPGENKIAVQNLHIIKRLSFEEILEVNGYFVTPVDTIKEIVVEYVDKSFHFINSNLTAFDSFISHDSSKISKSLNLKNGDMFLAKVKFFKNNYANMLRDRDIRNIKYGQGIRVPSLVSLESRLIPLK